MQSSLYKTDSLFVRTLCARTLRALALMGAAVLAVSAVPQGAAAQTQQWHARDFQAGVNGVDNAVDIVYWEDTNATPTEQWVYVTGYHTTPNGATVFATSKYPAQYTGPGENDPVTVYYPPDPATATGGNRAVAIDIDFEGNVYVTGESSDPTGANGHDIVIIKYDKNLVPDEDWILAGHQGAVVRWDNPFVTGPLNHDRAVDLSLATGYEPDPKNPNVIGVTGTTFVGTQTGRNDIVTLHFNTNTGDLVNTFGTGGAVIKAGTANTDDIPVGIKMYWEAVPDELFLQTVVAGTIRQVNSGQVNDDIWTTEYNVVGNVMWEAIYNGPMNRNDTATTPRRRWSSACHFATLCL